VVVFSSPPPHAASTSGTTTRAAHIRRLIYTSSPALDAAPCAAHFLPAAPAGLPPSAPARGGEFARGRVVGPPPQPRPPPRAPPIAPRPLRPGFRPPPRRGGGIPGSPRRRTPVPRPRPVPRRAPCPAPARTPPPTRTPPRRA